MGGLTRKKNLQHLNKKRRGNINPPAPFRKGGVDRLKIFLSGAPVIRPARKVALADGGWRPRRWAVLMTRNHGRACWRKFITRNPCEPRRWTHDSKARENLRTTCKSGAGAFLRTTHTSDAHARQTSESKRKWRKYQKYSRRRFIILQIVFRRRIIFKKNSSGGQYAPPFFV